MFHSIPDAKFLFSQLEQLEQLEPREKRLTSFHNTETKYKIFLTEKNKESIRNWQTKDDASFNFKPKALWIREKEIKSVISEKAKDTNTIQKLRAGKSILSYRRRKVLTSSELERINPRLGKETDTGIAADFEVNKSTIRKLRKRKSILPYRPYTVLTLSELELINPRPRERN